MRFAYYSWLLALFVMILSLAPLSTHVAASDKTWTTTGDFESGSFQIMDGNRGATTSSHNPGVTSGQIELDSLKGDAFEDPDPDATTAKWDAVTRVSAGTCSSFTTTIAAGSLYLNTTTSGASTCEDGVIGTSTISGDVDYQWKVSMPVFGTTGSSRVRVQLLSYKTILYSDSPVKGAMIQVVSGATNFMQAFTINTGSVTQCGSNTNIPSNANPVWLRMARISDAWYFNYSTDGSSFSNIGGPCTRAAGAVYPTVMLSTSDTSITRASAWDDFKLNRGIVDADGYRHSGEWTSPIYGPIPDGKMIANITIGLAGLSATYRISSVTFISNGLPVETNSTAIISGTSAVVIPSEVIGSGDYFQVELSLAGDGGGTPVITSVDVTLGPLIQAQSNAGMSTLLIVLLIVFVLLLLLGLKFPIMHIFGGLEGVFLGLQIFNELGDTALAGIVAGVAVLFVLIGAARMLDGVRT